MTALNLPVKGQNFNGIESQVFLPIMTAFVKFSSFSLND